MRTVTSFIALGISLAICAFDGWKTKFKAAIYFKNYYALHLKSVAMTSLKFDKNLLRLWLIYNDADWPIAKFRLGVGFTATIAAMGTLDTHSRLGD